MRPQIQLSPTFQKLLRCPICHAQVQPVDHEFVCENSECASHFPIVDGVPVLLNEQSSVFSLEEFVSYRETFFRDTSERRLKNSLLQFIPGRDKNQKSTRNFSRFVDLLKTQSKSPQILVIGGSIVGKGMETLVQDRELILVESDVAFGPRTTLICDAHDIPFHDKSFDGVVAQAILEHVVDPYRCVEEIYRVLNDKGLVYAETPFMQQVHGGRFDFTRFTHLGHRRLFRWFDEIDSGAIRGPGMALAWSYEYFLTSFTTSKNMRTLAKIFARFTSFYLKYFDAILMNKPGALDAASGYYFMGRKAEKALTDRELLKLYCGSG